MARGEIVFKILEFLQGGTEATAGLLDIFTSDYHSSYRKMKRMIRHGPPPLKINWASDNQKSQQFYSLLNQLKNQGLVRKEKSEHKRGSLWRITGKGLAKLKLIRGRRFLNKKSANYKRESDDKIKVVIFDIPEKERGKRTWLRIALIILGFSMLQRSVWVGKNKIPEQFISDLKERDMLSYVQIFEISKKGTIAQKF